MEKYIISLNGKLWVKSLSPDLVLNKSPEEAATYDKIGDAMRTAGELNGLTGHSIAKIRKYKVEIYMSLPSRIYQPFLLINHKNKHISMQVMQIRCHRLKNLLTQRPETKSI